MAKSKPEPESTFTGRWRIVSMSAWDEDFIDEEEEGYFEFGAKGGGEFHFGYVHGNMDGKPTIRDGEPAVEWTWDGNDEMDPAQGRGQRTARHDLLPRRRRLRVRGEDNGRGTFTKPGTVCPWCSGGEAVP